MAMAALIAVEVGESGVLVPTMVVSLRGSAAWEPLSFYHHVVAELPEGMRPPLVRVVDNIPLMPTFERDRGALMGLVSSPSAIQEAPNHGWSILVASRRAYTSLGSASGFATLRTLLDA